ncbi:hypothetical protein B0H10DRAFT_1949374 [Mycena sp. CBHHK59/15]|nr:hypothetical protein B0H10DRAFT_1949374 [Mycena sp. CBHHK59/15]
MSAPFIYVPDVTAEIQGHQKSPYHSGEHRPDVQSMLPSRGPNVYSSYALQNPPYKYAAKNFPLLTHTMREMKEFLGSGMDNFVITRLIIPTPTTHTIMLRDTGAPGAAKNVNMQPVGHFR